MSITPTEIRPLVDIGASERRSAALDEVELVEENGKQRFTGYAVVTGQLSEDLGGFRERIMHGAVRKALATNPDVKLLVEHDQARLLARTSSGTLKLNEDQRGLKVDADLPDTRDGRDMRILLDRGDIREMSFGFRVGKGNDTWTEEDGGIIRSVRAFESLFDVSLTAWPAYVGTDASLRSLACGIEIIDQFGEVVEPQLRDIAWKIHRGNLEATVEERSAIDAAFARTESVSPWIAQRALMAACQEPELQGAIQGKRVTVAVEDAPSGELAYRLAARQRRLRLHTH